MLQVKTNSDQECDRCGLVTPATLLHAAASAVGDTGASETREMGPRSDRDYYRRDRVTILLDFWTLQLRLDMSVYRKYCISLLDPVTRSCYFVTLLDHAT